MLKHLKKSLLVSSSSVALLCCQINFQAECLVTLSISLHHLGKGAATAHRTLILMKFIHQLQEHQSSYSKLWAQPCCLLLILFYPAESNSRVVCKVDFKRKKDRSHHSLMLGWNDCKDLDYTGKFPNMNSHSFIHNLDCKNGLLCLS